MIMEIKFDCKYFNGYKPCLPHKRYGVICKDCKFYSKIKEKILIIKLRAAGDVIRHTIILHKLREIYPDAYITWITDYPDLVNEHYVDRILKWDWKTVYQLENENFDVVYCFDKDKDAATLINKINAKQKFGFSVDKNGRIIPINRYAKHKFITGVFDNIMKENKKHFLEEIYEICGWEYNNERYILPDPIPFDKQIPIGKKKKIIGLNTGAGEAWRTRIWPEKYWIELAKKLKKEGYTVVLLGGELEHEKNIRISKKSGALYFGTMNLRRFIGLVEKCDVIVTTVSLALHIALGLNKKVVLFVNIFPTNEFHLFNNGIILEPNLPCQACYKSEFDENCPVKNCMELIKPITVLDSIKKILS